MQKVNLNGQVLSEKEMREVKGGVIIEGDDPTIMNFCPACSEAYDKTDKRYFIGPDEDGFYIAICKNCGSVNKVK